MGFNAKLFEVNLYLDSYPLSRLPDDLSNKQIRHYAYILHDMDDSKPHIHVMLRTTDTRNSDHVAQWFGVGSNLVEKVKGRFADALLYLTHQNAPDKFQYSPDGVHSNFEWKKEAEKKTRQQVEDELYDRIISGEIKEYNFHRHIPGPFYIKNQRKIKTAFEYRKQIIRSKGRNMDSIYITGDSGVGKTSLAKIIADQRNLHFFVSSGSNDILDGYQGQECIILDDLRPSCMGLSDLLKLLDPHTASSVKSRYSNKVLECQLIIITTTLPIDQFFQNVFQSEKETAVQFKRRCGCHIQVTREWLFSSLWDASKNEYLAPLKTVNPVPGVRNTKTLSKEEQVVQLQQITGLSELYRRLSEKDD